MNNGSVDEDSLAQDSVKSVPARTQDTMSQKHATLVAIVGDAIIEKIAAPLKCLFGVILNEMDTVGGKMRKL